MSEHTIDVRLTEFFDLGHIPGSISNPVLQMGFVDRLPADWEQSDTIHIIGEDGESQEAEMAAEKLRRAGFQNISIADGGYQSWLLTSGEHTPSTPPPPPMPVGILAVNTDASEIQWTGRNLLNRHYGTLRFSQAVLQFNQGALTGGTFTVDWDSLACTDLAGDPLHDVLMTHLKDHDFFDIAHYDAPFIRIIGSRSLEPAGAGAPNLAIQAELTLKDVTRALEFEAVSGFDPEGHFAFQAAFSFDRTLWNVKYGSARFFKGLGMHLVNDRIEIGLKVVTR